MAKKTPIEIFEKHGAHYYECDKQSIVDAMNEYVKPYDRMLEEINIIMWESHMVKGRGLTEADGDKIMKVLERWAEQ